MTEDKIRAAAALRPPKPKRFYKEAGVKAEVDGFVVVLDGRPVHTPKRRLLALPSLALADAVAAEWAAQQAEIDATTMPMTQLANTAIDGVRDTVEAVLDSIHAYARSDMLCYRVAYPQSLAVSQAETWQPVLDWAEMTVGARMRVTTGIIAVEQPAESLAAIRRAFAQYDAWCLTAGHALTTAYGSVLLALAVLEGQMSLEQAFAASRLDETFQEMIWGEDAEAKRRADAIAQDAAAAARFAALVVA